MTLPLIACTCGLWHSLGYACDTPSQLDAVPVELPDTAARAVELARHLGVELTEWQRRLVVSVFGSSPLRPSQQAGFSLPREGGGGRAEPTSAEGRRADPIRSQGARS